ncbi:MAG: hypothetical protein Q8L87_10650, partial [Anaerolineales bacterium]|nr:hypothetical protein [Anaerolineales bacterium]
MFIAPHIIPSEPSNLSADIRLREFAHRLAKTHEIETAKTSRPKETTLLEYLKSWELALRNAYAIFKAAPSKGLPDLTGKSSRAGEWMLDNFYVVKQTIRQIEEDLPGSFLVELPKLSETSLQGHSRIFALAREWIGYSQGQIDLTQAAIFVQDYQQVMPLTIGELWALPIMLRIGILERLAYATSELTGIEVSKSLSEIPIQFAVSLPNDTIIANCFLSLRLLSATDWKDFFEETSRVEQILRNDPAQIYADMDFDTRNNYRSVIEELARHSKHSEEQVALAAVDFARNAKNESSTRKTHVGFYLIDAGRATLENSINDKPGFRVRAQRALLAFPTATYLGSIAALSILFVLGLLTYTALSSGSPLQLIVAGALGLGLAFEAAITIIHWGITHRVKPQSLPRMDFSEGIPAGNRSMVVVPTLLESEEELSHLLQELELYYLSNPDPLLTYALLTDFGDAPKEDMPEDEELLALASAGIENLNKKYEKAAPFYLFHRHRQWNPS